MPRRRRRKKSVSGYFRQVFDQHPEWLKEKSNDLILAQYRRDHNMSFDTPVKESVRNNLANIKSVLRKKKGLGSYAGKKARTMQRAGSATHRLEELESQIDDCMMTARSIDPVGLESIIALLRRARYEVVWKMG
jgi:hypothetical protein